MLLVLFVIKNVNAPYAAIIVILSIAGYATAFPKGYAKQRAIGIVPYNKNCKNKINRYGFNRLHSSSVS
jgi:acetate kinase